MWLRRCELIGMIDNPDSFDCIRIASSEDRQQKIRNDDNSKRPSISCLLAYLTFFLTKFGISYFVSFLVIVSSSVPRSWKTGRGYADVMDATWSRRLDFWAFREFDYSATATAHTYFPTGRETRKMHPSLHWLLLLILSVGLWSTEAFTSSRYRVTRPTCLRQDELLPLHVFGRKNNNDESEETQQSGNGGRKRSIPFFGRLSRSKKSKEEDTVSVEEDNGGAMATTRTATVSKPTIRASEPEDPAKKADFLRAQAQRARLEAEKMDAELTLSKIEKLEKEVLVAKTKGESVEDLQRELDNLQAKLRGEPPKPKPIPAETTTTVTTKAPEKTVLVEVAEPSTPSPQVNMNLDLGDLVQSGDFEEIQKLVNESPGFMQKVMATLVEVDFETTADINTTEVATRLLMMAENDYSFSSVQTTFTEEEIEETIKRIKKDEVTVPESWREEAGVDERKLAQYILKQEKYIESRLGGTDEALIETLQKVGEGEEWMQPILEAMNRSAVDQLYESLYPKCTRKEGEEPTLAQVQSLVGTVLPQVKFSTSAKPEKVVGGYIIRGTHSFKNGDELITAIDRELEKCNLADKMTVLYSVDYTVMADQEMIDDFTTDPFNIDTQILFVGGPDMVRERRPVLLSLTSAIGFATSWYLSIYPFLLNSALSQRVEEQLAVADAGMNYDLEWLTDLSVPLFWSFLAIQLIHELGHRIVAAFYDMKVSVPTLVPSLLTGTTSTVTTFKELPKNKEAMFDFAVAGPVAGILASVAALYVGSQLTLTSDPATLPGLPIEILRQSTLGGGIIDNVIQGSLYLPEGATTSSGITIALHPLAVAGYISLIVNALALLPIGTTDGGRIGVTLFGRMNKAIVGTFTLLALLLAGVSGSDLFLFYFAFVIAFQTGNEVPARNEVDDISFPRVLLATAAFATAFLALVPFQ